MNTAPNSVFDRNSVIPTEVRPSGFGWSNRVEEPVVSLLRHTACVIGKSIAFVAALALVLPLITGVADAQKAAGTEAQRQLSDLLTGERQCRALLDRTGEGARPHMGIGVYWHMGIDEYRQ